MSEKTGSSFLVGIFFSASLSFLIVGWYTTDHRGQSAGSCFPNKTCHEGFHCVTGNGFSGVCLDLMNVKMDGNGVYITPKPTLDGGTQ